MRIGIATTVATAIAIGVLVSAGGGGASCAGAAVYQPGSPDGTGTCWPGPNNTGVPAGTTLTAYGGSCTITTPNTTIDSKTVNCDLSVQAANFLIKNSRVTGQVILDTDLPGASGWSMTIQDTEIDAGTDQTSAAGFGNMTVRRANLHGGQNGAQCEAPSTTCDIQDSYIWGQFIPDNANWHLDGFITNGITNLVIKHNYIICDHAINNIAEGCTADLALIPNFAAIDGAQIEHNLLGANTGQSYCTYGGEKPSSPTPHSINVHYVNNVFKRGTNNLCGAFGPVTDFAVGNTGNQWTANIYEDGTTIPAP